MIKAIQIVGIVLCMVGASSMDSQSLVIPIAMLAAGMAIVGIAEQFTEIE